jgi:hypothetical protein
MFFKHQFSKEETKLKQGIIKFSNEEVRETNVPI